MSCAAAMLGAVAAFFGACGCATAQSDPSRAQLDQLSQQLACHSLAPDRILCRQPSELGRPLLGNVSPDVAFGTALSLHTANNLATEAATAKLLRGLTGSVEFGEKAAPEILRLSRSTPARYGLWIAVLGTGALAVYERMTGGSSEAGAAKPDEALSEYRLIGTVNATGQFLQAK